MEPAGPSAATDPTLSPGSVEPSSPASRLPRRPLWQALHAPAFRRLFLAQTVSRWGDTFNAVALVILVFRLTGPACGSPGRSPSRSSRCCSLAFSPGRSSTAIPAGGS